MSKFLAKLIGEDAVRFSKEITRLEVVAAHPKADIHLTTRIKQLVNQKCHDLGFNDPSDTTAEELYHALIVKALRFDDHLGVKVSGGQIVSANQVLSTMAANLKRSSAPQEVWAIKRSVVRNMLSKTPPKKVMKQLGYRSATSMLKLEPVGEILAAARLMEVDKWQLTFAKQIETLRPSDFENRDIEIIELNSERWQSIVEHLHFGDVLAVMPEIGTIALLPLDVQNQDGLRLVLLVHLLESYRQLRFWSAFIKFQQVSGAFEKAVHAAVVSHQLPEFKIHNQQFSLEIIFSAAHRSSTFFDSLFDGRLDSKDVVIPPIPELLSRMYGYDWWLSTESAGFEQQGQVVSFDLTDLSHDLLTHRGDFSKRSLHGLKQGVWLKLLSTYALAPANMNKIAEQLDNYQPKLETKSISKKSKNPLTVSRSLKRKVK